MCLSIFLLRLTTQTIRKSHKKEKKGMQKHTKQDGKSESSCLLNWLQPWAGLGRLGNSSSSALSPWRQRTPSGASRCLAPFICTDCADCMVAIKLLDSGHAPCWQCWARLPRPGECLCKGASALRCWCTCVVVITARACAGHLWRGCAAEGFIVLVVLRS